MKAEKMTDGPLTPGRLRHLIVQRDLAERVASIAVSIEPNENGHLSIVVACPLFEAEQLGNPDVALRMTEAIGIMVNNSLTKALSERDRIVEYIRRQGDSCSALAVADRIAAGDHLVRR